MEKYKIAVVGYGCRGKGLAEDIVSLFLDRVEVIGICDNIKLRADGGSDFFEQKTKKRPLSTTDFDDIIAIKPDAVIIATSWQYHVPYACKAMEAGITVASEVGGAYSLQQCYDLIETHERTKTPFMFLENCCYGRLELLALNMKKLGLLGTVVHCEASYKHDLRAEVTCGYDKHHYRLSEYTTRNCDNYPTHGLGPIMQILDINHGNRPLTLCAMASKAEGLKEYSKEHYAKDHIANNVTYTQGDVVTTLIKCTGGETITMKLDTTLPSFYSRGFTVCGTKGGVYEDLRMVFLDGVHSKWEFSTDKLYNNIKEYYEKYDSDIWREYAKNPVGTHWGIDYLEFADFFDCAINDKPMPIDVYDAAIMMAVTPLTEISIARGGAPVDFPDFKKGNWIRRYETEKPILSPEDAKVVIPG